MRPLVTILLFMLAFSLIPQCGPTLPELHLYCWADYVKPALIKKFEKENHCHVVIDTFDSNESMYAKLRAGAIGYDLIIPSSYFVTLMMQQGLLQEINYSNIPNLAYVDWHSVRQTAPAIGHYGVPYMIGYTGIGYRKDRVKEIISSWSMFNRINLRGRMTMLNDLREVIGAALKNLGFSINTLEESEIDKASKLVIDWKNNLAKFESEQYKNGIASAEYLLVQAYSGDIIQVEHEDDAIAFLLPKEGIIISHDYIVMPKSTNNVALAEKFINFLQDPQIAAENTEAISNRCPNTESYKFLSESVRNNPAFFPPEEILEKSEVLKDLGPAIKLYNRAWDKIKEA